MPPKRDYTAEGRDYYGWGTSNPTAIQKKHRRDKTSRNAARAKLERQGRVHKGDGKDVDHANGNPQDNSAGNVRVMSRSKNRGRNNH